MQYLFGLGNPGAKYLSSRHNIGFRVLEETLRQHLAKGSGGDPVLVDVDSALKLNTKFNAKVCKHEQLFFVEPQTFMNNSGQAVRAVLDYYDKSLLSSQTLKNVWVIHDDLDLEAGKFKIQFGTGPKVHNGLQSINEHLHTDQYWHVRIGVDGRNGDRSTPPPDYVLSGFPPAEKAAVDAAVQAASFEVLRKLAEPS